MRHLGFSRFEFLAIGAVVSVASALLLPVLAQTAARQPVTSTQRADMCINNLKQVSLGIKQYINDFDERYPIIVVTTGSPNGVPPYGWADALQPYIRNTRVFQCPSERHRGQANPTMPGYTDYWYNANLQYANESSIQAPILNLTLGDGDGGLLASDARYSLKTLPKSWISTPNSPARRHIESRLLCLR